MKNKLLGLLLICSPLIACEKCLIMVDRRVEQLEERIELMKAHRLTDIAEKLEYERTGLLYAQLVMIHNHLEEIENDEEF